MNIIHARVRDYFTRLSTEESHKTMLLDARCILICQTSPVEVHESVAGSLAQSSSSSESAATQYGFFHVSLLYAKPWRPTLVRLALLSPASFPTLSSADNSQPEPILFQTHMNAGIPHVLSVWEWLATLDLNQKVDLQLLCLSSRAKPCADVRKVTAFRVNALGCQVWRGVQVERSCPVAPEAQAVWQEHPAKEKMSDLPHPRVFLSDSCCRLVTIFGWSL